MEIYGNTRKLSKIISSEKLIIKQYGKMVGAKLMQRISEFRATDSLSEISHLPPPRLHSLGGDRNGEFAVSLTGNERLVFKGLDINNEFTSNKSQVVKIYILEVVDYHGN